MANEMIKGWYTFRPSAPLEGQRRATIDLRSEREEEAPTRNPFEARKRLRDAQRKADAANQRRAEVVALLQRMTAGPQCADDAEWRDACEQVAALLLERVQ